jgi:hypothetical protein
MEGDQATAATRPRGAAGVRGAAWVLAATLVVGVVLRVVDLGRPTLDFDETFSAVTARIPLHALFGFLRHFDSHPPLDYLLRRPAASATASAVPGTTPASEAVLTHLRTVAQPGDAVAVHPAWLSPLIYWYFSVKHPDPERALNLAPLQADTLVLGDGPWDGRVWLIEPTSYTTPDAGLRPCAPVWTRNNYRLLCFEQGMGP